MKVSVAMITYNHEEFIAQAVESALMQETDFDYEIVIGEDCSTDGTGEILKTYQKVHPDKVRVLPRERNLGIHRNFVDTLGSCTGKYVALLEGDDYWISPHKLQKQVDFLDNHPECVLSFHNVKQFYQDGSREAMLRNSIDQKAILSLEDVLVDHSITTCSVMFRNGLVTELPPWFYTLPVGDWPFWILLAQHGNLGYINEVMASYRRHPGGLYSSKTCLEWLPRILETYDVVDRALSYKYHSYVEEGKTRWTQATAQQYFAEVVKSMGPAEAAQAFASVFDQCTEWNPSLRKQLLGKLCATYFFHAAAVEDYATVRKSSLMLARYAPFRFKERRVLSRAVKALMGPHMANWVRKAMRWAGL